jgi:haloalkane dehalogenase
MDLLRTPDERFTDLPGFDFEPRYVEVAASDTPPIRMAYVDEGPAEGQPIVLLHGEPSWSFLYRSMIPPLVAAGYRVLAPDLIGFGRSDKPTQVSDYSYLRHMEWVTAWFEALDLRNTVLFVQDWGSLIGLRLAAEQNHLVSRIMVGNGFLPTAETKTPPAFHIWRTFARFTPVFPAGRIVDTGTVTKLSKRVRAAYDAPYPSAAYQAGARAFPGLVPTSESDPAVPANRAAWERLGQWDKPFLCVFGTKDPILGKADRRLIEHVPGAAGQPHGRILGGHFIQEDCGPELAERMISWIHGTQG